MRTSRTIVDWMQNIKSFSTAFEPESGAEGHYIVVLTASERQRLMDAAPHDLRAALDNVGGYIATDPEIAAYHARNAA